ncbi:hypothetical protein SRB5_37870 [Streptomyces sp. RB5]|uniref:Globin n=1 Tax=Streptomyces smaragdinus TaxID=2585196 RepID=A0A7K0CJJ6_9ACTN|nr:group II truncated hemoglobin [Streptomyces smaragdinus]MQY13637.1 hypothetical protein [Streptomyces smaragdinus]
MTTPSIYDWAGGAEAFDRLTTAFYREVHKDPLLAPVFAAAPAEHPHHVALFLAEVFGGPRTYSADHGGHDGMARHHLGRHITQEQRRRWVSLLMDAADEVGLAADPEFRAVFAYYIEWGTRMAIVYSGDDAPPTEGPMPAWDWGQTPPWVPPPGA